MSGVACPAAKGQYLYEKRKRQVNRPLLVDVYPLAVIRQFDDWPEREQRQARWFSLNEAAKLVNEPELQAIIADFSAPPPMAGLGQRALQWVREQSAERIKLVRWFQAQIGSGACWERVCTDV